MIIYFTVSYKGSISFRTGAAGSFFAERDLFRSDFHDVVRDHHIVEADAACMERVIPDMVLAVDPAEGRNGDPAVDEDRVDQQVQPGLEGSADLPHDRHREHVLADADKLPDLHGQYGVQYVGIERNEVVDVGADDEER